MLRTSKKRQPTFFREYSCSILDSAAFLVEEIDAGMVYETFRRTPESAPGMDGWQSEELSLFSIEVCRHIAALFLLIEEGEPWPNATTHARGIYLETRGPQLGES